MPVHDMVAAAAGLHAWPLRSVANVGHWVGLGDDEARARVLMSLQVAMGFVRVANETMCRPIRALTQMKGYDVAQHCLACFGGAGGQHACAIAQNLGMRTIFVHRYAGVLSAVGIGLADVVAEEQVHAPLQ